MSWKPEVIENDAPPVSKELKKRWSHFITKVYETDPLTCPKCQAEMRIISFIDQPKVIKKILQHLGLWEESHAPLRRDPPVKEITFDPSHSQQVILGLLATGITFGLGRAIGTSLAGLTKYGLTRTP